MGRGVSTAFNEGAGLQCDLAGPRARCRQDVRKCWPGGTLADHRMVWLPPKQPSAGRDIDGKACRCSFELPCDLADLSEPTRRSRRERGDIEGLVQSEKDRAGKYTAPHCGVVGLRCPSRAPGRRVRELAARPNRRPALTFRGQWKGVVVLRLEIWTCWDRPAGPGWENVTRVMTAVSDC